MGLVKDACNASRPWRLSLAFSIACILRATISRDDAERYGQGEVVIDSSTSLVHVHRDHCKTRSQLTS